MSRSKHGDVTESYLADLLKTTKKCPRRRCKGVMIEVLVRYTDRGPLFKEHECVSCGKVIRHPKVEGNYENFKKEKKESKCKSK